MYQQYLKDPASVDKAWWDFFADYSAPDPAGEAPAPPTPTPTAAAPSAPASSTPVPAAPPVPRQAVPPAAAATNGGAPSTSDTVAAVDETVPLRGATVRDIPAKLVADNRLVMNNHLKRGRGGKISFTHIIGYAIVKATAAQPEMNVAYTEI